MTKLVTYFTQILTPKMLSVIVAAKSFVYISFIFMKDV